MFRNPSGEVGSAGGGGGGGGSGGEEVGYLSCKLVARVAQRARLQILSKAR